MAHRRLLSGDGLVGLQVHELVTNGDRLAMRFSEHGMVPAEGNRCAAWGGIGLYKWNGAQLIENWVEQDFLAQHAQLSGAVSAAPLESPHLDPWVGTRAEPANRDAESVVRDWLARRDLRDAPERVIDRTLDRSVRSGRSTSARSLSTARLDARSDSRPRSPLRPRAGGSSDSSSSSSANSSA